MTDRQIHIFLAAADHLNFTAAANELYLSQQAVTRQIAALESEVGVRLFSRTTREVRLTPAGEIFRREFQAIDRQARRCMDKIRSLGTKSTDVVSIGIFQHFPRNELTFPLMTRLMQEFPEIYFDVRLLDFAQLRSQMTDGLLDLCVTTSGDWKLWPNVNVTVCRRKQFQIVYSRHMGIKEPFTVEQLKAFPQLVLPPGVQLSTHEPWMRTVPFLHYQPCPDLTTLVVRLQAGQGFSMLTRVFDGSESPDLVYHPVPSPDAHADVVCLTDSGRDNPRLPPIVRAIREFLSALPYLAD